MNLRQLKYFVKVVDCGNMTRAAGELFVAQPALGMQIRQLEEDLGVALLVRHSRGVEPTKAGALLHARARAILGLVEETRKEVAAAEGDASEAIRLGMTPSLMVVVGPDIAVGVRERLPQVFLSLVEAMSHVLADMLARGEVDLALAYDVPDVPALRRTAVYQEDLVLVTLPAGRSGEPVTFAEALEESLAMPEQGDSVREHVARAAREAGHEMRVAFEVRSIPAIRNLVLRGAASAILPYATVLDEVRAGRLDARPIAGPAIRRTLFLASSASRAPLVHGMALTGVIRASLSRLTETLGAVAHPLPPREP